MGKPTGFKEYERELPKRRPVEERVEDYEEIYQPFSKEKAKQQAARCMDCGVATCMSGCPLGNLIPEWNDAVYRGLWKEAFARLEATNNFPEFTGRVCPAPCEAACVAGINGEPVTIRQIELATIEKGFETGYIHTTPPELRFDKRVAVIGGGNVALDAARSALRLGADRVEIYYRRSREEMPVTEVEYDQAVAEGIQVNFLSNPTRIVSENWQVTGLQCIQMSLGEPDDSGRRRPVPVEGSEFFAEADTVIAAVGQAPDLSFLPADSALERTRWETLVVSNNTLATNVDGVFAGGDFVRGPGMVIEAIADGRRAAIAIEKYLKGDVSRVELYDLKTGVAEEAPAPEMEEVWEVQPRLVEPVLSTQERKTSFAEVELAFSREMAGQEAKRCLRCDLES